jgi:hypothetical protein
MAKHILCSISTRGRYDSTLPLAIQSVLMQKLKPDKLVLFDDNDEPVDLRNNQTYLYLFQMLDLNGIEWEVIFGEKKGQHFNHQKANEMGYTWVWRLDDDTVAEPDVLEKLMSVVKPNVGAVGGSILTPPFKRGIEATGKIENIDTEPNLQWDYISKTKDVDHLHCSFVYRAGKADYDLTLSRVAHREETMFTYELKKKGYRLLITPCVTWHLRNPQGGIRDGQKEMFDHDERLFRMKSIEGKTIVVLDNGMGDHIVFKRVLKDIKNPVVFSCYNDIIPGKSIAEANFLFGDLAPYNVYVMMEKWKWTGSLEDAFRKMYNVPKTAEPVAANEEAA